MKQVEGIGQGDGQRGSEQLGVEKLDCWAENTVGRDKAAEWHLPWEEAGLVRGAGSGEEEEVWRAARRGLAR